MTHDRESEIRDEMRAVLARLRVLEFALLEMLQGLTTDHAAVLAKGLCARVDVWSLGEGEEFTPLVDETATQQLTSLLCALGKVPSIGSASH